MSYPSPPPPPPPTGPQTFNAPHHIALDGPVRPPQPPRPPQRKRSMLFPVMVAGTAMLALGLAGGAAIVKIGDEQATALTSRTAPEVVEATRPENPIKLGDGTSEGVPVSASEIPAIIEKTMPSVVYIEVSKPVNATDASQGREGGTGSGFVIKEDGYIMTNNHVIEFAKENKNTTIDVIFQDGSRYPATIVGTAPDYDIAVLKIDADNLPVIPLADSNDIRVGETAIAIGAPLGLDGTVTVGIVSSKNRPFSVGDGEDSAIYDSIQTDAAINPGNSGGPLLNGAGAVIGVNSAILTLGQGSAETGPESGSIGLGFAIPINPAARVAEDIINTGKAETPKIGVSLGYTYEGIGAELEAVTTGSPADKAGLLRGDIVTKVNQRVIISPDDLVVAVREYAPGEKVTVEYTRQGKPYTASIILGVSG